MENYHDLGGLVKLLRIAYSLANWPEMIDIANHLHATVCGVYEEQCSNEQEQNRLPLHKERPLVYYYGISLLMKGIALKKQKKYTEARCCIRQYEDLGWFQNLDDKGIKEVQCMSFFAKANSFALDLLEGKFEVLPVYIQFLIDNPQEIVPGFLNVLEAALLHNYDLKDEIDVLIAKFNPDTTTADPLIFSQYARITYLLIIYYFKNNDYKQGLAYTLNALDNFIHLNDMCGFKRCVSMFEMFRTYASTGQIDKYQNMLAGIVQAELIKEDVVFDGNHPVISYGQL